TRTPADWTPGPFIWQNPAAVGDDAAFRRLCQELEAARLPSPARQLGAASGRRGSARARDAPRSGRRVGSVPARRLVAKGTRRGAARRRGSAVSGLDAGSTEAGSLLEPRARVGLEDGDELMPTIVSVHSFRDRKSV